jgi:hypothetical protein
LQLTNVDPGIDLQAGLSADVTVDIHSRSGSRNANVTAAKAQVPD